MKGIDWLIGFVAPGAPAALRAIDAEGLDCSGSNFKIWGGGVES